MGNWDGYTPNERDSAINTIMLRDKIKKILFEVEHPLNWADEIKTHPSVVNRLVTVQEILKELVEDVSAGIPVKQ